MKYYKTLSKEGRKIITISLWGDDEEFTKHAEELITELLEEVKKGEERVEQ